VQLCRLCDNGYVGSGFACNNCGGRGTQGPEAEGIIGRLLGWPAVAHKGVGAAAAKATAAVRASTRTAPRYPGLAPEKTCWLQTILNQAEGEGLVIDGIYGPLSRAAVVRFQTKYGLRVDGIVGPQTETALTQTALNRIAQASLVPVNGVFDARTREEVVRFQTRSRLVADGIVGPRTRAAMVAALGGRCPVFYPGGGVTGGTTGGTTGGWTGGGGTRPTTCDDRRLEAMLEQCKQQALQAGINCLREFGVGAAEAAGILSNLIELTMATIEIPVVGEIAAFITGVTAGFLGAREIFEAATCIRNVLAQAQACRQAALAATGCTQ
jgi:peptidoglycan hydrolase-like protein with peptidoglycan-binding domain